MVFKCRLLLPKDLNVTGEPVQFRGRCWRGAGGGFRGSLGRRPQTPFGSAKVQARGWKRAGAVHVSITWINSERAGEPPQSRRSRRAGEPQSRRAAEPASRRAGEPQSRRAAEPASRRAGEPQSRRAAEPAYMMTNRSTGRAGAFLTSLS